MISNANLITYGCLGKAKALICGFNRSKIKILCPESKKHIKPSFIFYLKPFGSRSGPTFCRSLSRSKLFAKVISRRQKLPASKERVKYRFGFFVSYIILLISLCTAFGTLMDDDVLVLPLDMLQYDRHKPSVDEVLSRFKQV